MNLELLFIVLCQTGHSSFFVEEIKVRLGNTLMVDIAFYKFLEFHVVHYFAKYEVHGFDKLSLDLVIAFFGDNGNHFLNSLVPVLFYVFLNFLHLY